MYCNVVKIYLKEPGDGLPGVCLHTGHVLKQPEQMTIDGVEFTQRNEHAIELKEQATISA